MDEFSAAAALAVGAGFVITAYKDDILAGLERVDRRFLDLLKPLKPYIYRKRHGKKKAKHRFDASQPSSRFHADGSRYVPDWQSQASAA